MVELLKEESAVTAIEYGLLAALIAVAIIMALSVLGVALTDIFAAIADALFDVGGGDPRGGHPAFPDPCEKGGTNCGVSP